MRAFIPAALVFLLAQPAVHGGERGTGTWGAAQMQANPVDFGAVDWSREGFSNHSLRQVVRVSAGGSRVAVRLSNLFGQGALHVGGATLARAGQGGAVRPWTSRPVTFGGQPEVIIPAGEERVSDPVRMGVAPLESLTVTIYLPDPTGPATYHQQAQATSYRAAGNQLGDEAASSFTESSPSWYYLTEVDVTGHPQPARDAVVAFGDSITDGAFSTPDANHRYPDVLAERLHRQRLAVLNTGMGGNRLLTDTVCFGQRATARFQRDVLDRPGARSVIVLLGINDIFAPELASIPQVGACAAENPVVTGAQLIEGHRTLIRAAHARGVRIIGGTITPFKGPDKPPPGGFPTLWTERGEQVRTEVNDWIRGGGEYDAIVDFAAVVADPSDPRRIRPDLDAGDGVHPNDAGLRAMAEAIDLAAL